MSQVQQQFVVLTHGATGTTFVADRRERMRMPTEQSLALLKLPQNG